MNRAGVNSEDLKKSGPEEWGESRWIRREHSRSKEESLQS